MFNIKKIIILQEINNPQHETEDALIDDASKSDLIEVKKQLGMYCPIAKVIRKAGTKINENLTKVN